MKLVPVYGGQFAKVSDEDFDKVMSYKWHFINPKANNYYVVTTLPKGSQPKTIMLHRMIMGVTERLQCVDHINHDPLDNRRENLRVCTHSQNNRNKRASKKGTSKYLGVFQRRTNNATGRYECSIRKGDKMVYLGSFPGTPEGEIMAAKTYDTAAYAEHGQFANLNFKQH